MFGFEISKLYKFFIPVILLIIGIYLVPIDIFETDFSKIPGDLGDARFNNYILEHGYNFFTGKVNSYWDAPMMYPYKSSVTFSDNLLGSLPIYILCRVIGFTRETAFQLWILSMFILNFVCCYFALKNWSKNTVLSSVGAYIFAFSILLIGNIYNVQTLPRFIFPLLFYWLWRWLVVMDIKYFIWLSIGLVYQFYCGIYLGFLSFYVLLFFIISYLLISPERRTFISSFHNKIYSLKIIITSIVGVVFLAPLMLPYYLHSKIHGERTFDEVINSIPHVQSYFFTDSSSVFWGILSEHGKSMTDWWCHFLFIGAVPWLCIILSPIILLSKKISDTNKTFLKILLFTLFMSLLFALNFNGWTLYKLIYYIPGFSSMRSVNRIINTEVFVFILIIIFFFKSLEKITKYGKYIIAILPLLVIADNLIYPERIMRFDKKEAQERTLFVKENIKLQLKTNCNTIAYMPFNIFDDQLLNINIDAMIASQDLQLKCVNAYTGSYPNHFFPFFANLDYNNLNNWLTHNNAKLSDVCIINEIGKKEIGRVEINLMFDSDYLSRDWNLTIIADKKEASLWEKFTLISFEDGSYSIRSFENFFVTSEQNDKNQLIANRKFRGDWEGFVKIDLDSNYVAFKASNNKYWSVNPETLQVFANADNIGENEKFRLKKIN